MKKGSKILGRLMSYSIIAFSVYILLGVMIQKEEFYIFGYRPVLVLSGSMEPYMETNSIAIVQKTKDINEGDTYTNYLNEEGILRIDNLTEKVSEVRERVEGNALHDRLFCIYLCEKIARKCESEIKKLKSDLPTRIMQNPKLEDRNLLLKNLNILVSDTASVMEKLNSNDKKIVQGALYWLEEQKEKILERYAMSEISALSKQLSASKNPGDHFEFPMQTKTIKNIVRKEKQSFYAESLDKALEKLKEGYQSLIKIDCSKEESIYDLLYKTRFTEQIKFYGCDNATKEINEIIRFLQDTKKKVEYGDMEVR